MKTGKYLKHFSLEQPKCFLLIYKVTEAILMLGIVLLISLCYKYICSIFR